MLALLACLRIHLFPVLRFSDQPHNSHGHDVFFDDEQASEHEHICIITHGVFLGSLAFIRRRRGPLFFSGQEKKPSIDVSMVVLDTPFLQEREGPKPMYGGLGS